MVDRNKIDKLFKKHCKKCKDYCCGKEKEVTVFRSEINNIRKVSWDNLSFIKQGRRVNWRRKNIRRIKLKNHQCPFLSANKCIFGPLNRPVDCLSYPIFPAIKYKKGVALIKYMVVHKSCSKFQSISKDLGLIKIIYDFWSEIVKQKQTKDLKEWFGDKKNYWLDKNLVKIKVL